MKVEQVTVVERSAGPPARPPLFVALVILYASILLAVPAPPAVLPVEEDIFQSTNLLRISIQIPEAGLQTLRSFDGRRRGNEVKPKARARVTEGGRSYTNVTVQLKGFTSFQPIDGLPGLTLDFDKLAPKQNFHGLTKISLNNSLQDPTRLNEKMSRELFAAAGVPVPRADHAIVTLNGRELGLYVLTEAYDRRFLRRHFKRSDGDLFEGGVLQDIDQDIRLVTSGRPESNHSAVEKLIKASREPDPAERWRALNAAVDMNRFLSMVAMETILCHSDSYSMNRNNYRLYHDPATDKIVFMPHGMDRVLGTHRSPLDLTLVPPSLGLIARAVLSLPEGRRRYLERAGLLFTNLFDSDQLCRRVREIDSKIALARMQSTADAPFARMFGEPTMHAAEEMCNRIRARQVELQLQFSRFAELLIPTPTLLFNAEGSASLDGNWRLKPRPGQTELLCRIDAETGNRTLQVRTLKGPLMAVVQTRFNLPAGTYRLAGQIRTEGAAGPTDAAFVIVERYSGSRFAIEQRRFRANDVRFSFSVSEARAPEEIGILCEIRDEASEVRFDFSSLRLRRIGLVNGP